MAISFLSATAVGTGTAIAAYQADRTFLYWTVSGNSASASVWASPDGAAGWIQITAFTGNGIGATATAQLTALYPFIVGQIDWVSGGTRTASVTMHIVPRKYIV